MRWMDLCFWVVRTCPSSKMYLISNSSAVVPPFEVLPGPDGYREVRELLPVHPAVAVHVNLPK